MMGFLALAIVMTLAAVALVVVPLVRDPTRRAAVSGVIAAVAIPVAVALLYAAISRYPWNERPAPGANGGESLTASPADIQALKDRLAQQPDDQAGWVRLGDAYLEQELFGDARDAYRRALEIGGAGASDELRLALAETAILVDRDALTGEAGSIIDEVLARDPLNPKALWYGGLSALGRGDLQQARSRWSKLLELGPPPQVREIIEQQLARLEQGAPAVGANDATTGAAAKVRIPVRISIKPELVAQVRPGAALFLIARAPGGAGPPFAVVRRQAASLPLDLEISDADSMVPGRSLATLAEVQLTARMANDGEALPAAGDVFGEAVWTPGAESGARLSILMDQVVR